jgi:hypothetical protein
MTEATPTANVNISMVYRLADKNGVLRTLKIPRRRYVLVDKNNNVVYDGFDAKQMTFVLKSLK